MSKSNAAENAILALIFTAVAWANVADNAASAPIANIQYSLHTGDPDEAGDQTTNEAAYGSYAREAVARSGSGHTVTNNSVSPDADIEFTESTTGTETETHFAAGRDASGAGQVFYKGSISPTIGVPGAGVTPILTTATAITED